MIKLKSINGLVTILYVVFGLAIFLIIILKGLGGNEALFAILGYVAGWLSAIVAFFHRKPPAEGKS